MADRCTYNIQESGGGDRWVCGLSEDHDGDHYLMRPAPVGRVTPIAPNADRDKRRTAWAQRERDRARRYLDEWFRAVTDSDRMLAFADLLECLSAYACA